MDRKDYVALGRSEYARLQLCLSKHNEYLILPNLPQAYSDLIQMEHGPFSMAFTNEGDLMAALGKACCLCHESIGTRPPEPSKIKT